MPAPFRLLILTPGFPLDESDTTCIPALQDFAFGWKKFYPEVEVKIISFQYPHQVKKYFWNGIYVYCAGGKSRAGLHKLIAWWRVFVHLFFTKAKNQTVILSYFLTEATYVGQIFSGIYGMKHIAIAAGQDVRKNNRYLKRIDFRKLKVVALNQKMADELFRSCGRKADYIIPMGAIDIPGSDTQTRAIDILVVGSLIPLKRVDVAIGLIAALRNEFSNLKTAIIGDGPERNHLENKITEVLQSHIHFTGQISREEVFTKMKESKILLHTSEYEGQATVITEALACGMTVVCFDVGRIGGDTGVFNGQQKIYVCADENEMKNVLKKLLHENKFNFSPAIPLSIADTVNEYWKIIQSIS